MKRFYVLFSLLVLGIVVVAGMLSLQPAKAQMGTTEQLAKQLAFEKTIPQLQITEEVLPLVMPGHTLGETEGVSKDAKGNLYVYSRTGWSGTARAGNSAKLFMFDASGKFVKELMPDGYLQSFAHSVRIDKYGNIWAVDEGAGMIVKLDPNGNVIMTLGRKTESIDYLERFLERGEKIPEAQRHPVGGDYTFNRPTDVAWDAQDNIYISDGYGNSRFTKQDKNGMNFKGVGTFGAGPLQFNTVHTISADANNVYVGDRGNWRIQVFDTNMNFKANWTGIGMPWGTCISPGATPYLWSGDGTGKLYKMDMSGKVLGWAQTRANKGQTGCLIHEMHCESANVIYTGSCSQWNIEKITVK
jgi:hypothetical protein